MARAKKAYRLDPCRYLGQTARQRVAEAGWPGRGNNAPRPDLPTLLSWWQVMLTTGSDC
jgi:hypothetical protein